MRTIRFALVLSTLSASFIAAGCATAISGSADSISRLEKARTNDPKSEPVQRALGIAYFKANRYDDAHASLAQAAEMDPKDGVAALYLGLTAEAQNDLAGAQRAYERYLQVGKTRGAKNEVRARLEAIKLKRVQAEAKQALAREGQLAAGTASPTTVAVMPFQFTGADTSFKPLERGFAELITTDLSRISKLTVLERERLQALLDEMTLQQTAGVAEGTGVRAGKILQAGRMVGGVIQQQGDQLATSASVTDATTGALGSPARDQRSADEIFTMEKNIVLGVLQNMGITPTPAELNAIQQRPTKSLVAFLAYSRGLELSDQGRFDEAGRAFDNALRLDPSFGAAGQKSQEAKSAAATTSASANSVESSLKGTTEGATVAAATQGTTVTGTLSTGGGAASIAEGLNPSTAGAASTGGGSTTTQPTVDPSAGTGGDNPTTKSAKVSIVVRKP